MKKYGRWLKGLGVLAFVALIVVFYYMPPFVKMVVLTLLFSSLFIFMDKFGINLLRIRLAEKDVFWSPYRMAPKPGQINFMSWGITKPGPFAMVLTGYIPGWHYHAGDRMFYPDGGTKKEKALFRSKFPDGPPQANDVEVVWVGFFKRYYRRSRTWLAMDTAGQQHKIVEKNTTPENDHIFYFSTSMAQKIKQVSKVAGKSNAPVPVTLDVSYNVLLINPELAEFVAGKWEEKVVGAVDSRARIYINTRTVDQLRAEKDGKSKKEFVDALLRANLNQKKETGTVGLVDHFGVKIDGLFFEDFQLEEGDPEIFKAQKAVTIAALRVEEADQVILEKKKLGTAEKEMDLEKAIGIAAKVAAYTSQPGGEVVALAGAGNLHTLVISGDRVPVSIPLNPPAAPPAPPRKSTP